MRDEPVWVLPGVVAGTHWDQIDQFGGRAGVRDPGMLESALGRPVNLWHYGEPSHYQLAAAYAFGIARNHPFADGNKRTAFVVSALFLELNGYRLTASEPEAAQMFLALAAGEVDEETLTGWFEEHSSRER